MNLELYFTSVDPRSGEKSLSIDNVGWEWLLSLVIDYSWLSGGVRQYMFENGDSTA